MRKNERYIFFRDTRTQGAVGAEGVQLTPQRSMAIDTAFTPYGTPIWIDTVRPVARKPGATEPYRRLTIAQDAGTAIQGPARGDVFFGGGAAGRRLGRPHELRRPRHRAGPEQGVTLGARHSSGAS